MLSHNEYLDLVQRVNDYRQQINLFNIEEISESALDSLKHQITLFETQNPDLISQNSPNYLISGGVLEGFEKVAHKHRMLSLNDIFEHEELIDWERKWQDFATKNQINFEKEQKYICEPKVDGLAISLHYQDGNLIKAITRGDGYIGENVTENVKQINGVPKTIPHSGKIEVRGEIFITKSDFASLNEEIKSGKAIGKMGKTGVEGTFANTRNVASGTIRQLNSSIVSSRKLSFIAYNITIEE
jgi:DNA ligase (NAD+)